MALRYTSNSVYGSCEIKPRADAFVGEMINAWNYSLVNCRHDGARQITRIRRTANLVEDDTEVIAFPAQADHGLHEIIAKSGI